MTASEFVQIGALTVMVALVVATVLKSRGKGPGPRLATRRQATWSLLPFAVYLGAVAAEENGGSRYVMIGAAVIALAAFALGMRRNRAGMAADDR
jgi:hypothetical protein